MTNKKPKVFLGTFEDYTTVGDPVGNGGSGTVFKVRTSDGDILALKLLDPSKTPRAKLKRFRNELQFCSQPKSKHIIHVIDSGRTDDGSVFYVMRFYPKTVRNLIRDRLPQGELLPLYSQILDGTEAAHLLGACHRDIKPENLLYDSDVKQIVLADFGIARFVADELLTVVETGPNERLANFAYAAPEQRVAGKVVDQRADIYALGLILNELFTGEVPQGTGFRKIKDVAPSLAYLDELVEKMVRQQPDERPRSVTSVKDELIARGNEFVREQHLSILKKEVVPESEFDDPLVSDPIRVVEAEDYRAGSLTLRLNRPINPKWEHCFRRCATGFSVAFFGGNVSFQGDRASILVDSQFLQPSVNAFKLYCEQANREYATEVTREHAEQQKRLRFELQQRVAREEARMKILQSVKI